MTFKQFLTLTVACAIVTACGDGTDDSSIKISGPPDTTNTYTALATPLLNYIAADQAVTTAVSSSLNTSIILGADYFAATPSIMAQDHRHRQPPMLPMFHTKISIQA